MEDSLSVKSNESVATSDEFDFVSDKLEPTSKTPTLDIKNGGLNELKSALTEVLQETVRNMMGEVIGDHGIEPETEKRIGHSTFYSLVEPGKDPLSISPDEKQDPVKSDSNESNDTVDEGIIIIIVVVVVVVFLLFNRAYQCMKLFK